MALLLGAGGFYVWRFDSDLRLPGGAEAGNREDKLLLPDLKLAEIDRIGVIRANGSWSVLRTSTVPAPQDPFGNVVQWELKRPKGAPVEPVKVETMVRALAGLKIRNTIEPKEIVGDESVYGLTPPAVVLQLDGRFGKQVVSLGEKHPISGRRYVQIDGDERLFLTEDSIFSLLDVEADSLRISQVLAFDPKQVKKVIAIRDDGDVLSLEMVNERRDWKITSNAGVIEADGSQVQRALGQLAKAKVKRFVDDTPETLAFFGLARPKLIISLVFDRPSGAAATPTPLAEATVTPEGEGTDGEESYFPRKKVDDRVVIQIGEGINTDALLPPTPGETQLRSKASYFGKLSGVKTIFEFGRSYFSDFIQPGDHFRTKFPFRGIGPDSFGTIRLKFGGAQKGQAELRWAGSKGWTIGAPDATDGAAAKELSIDALAKLLDAVRRLRVVSYTTLPDQMESTGLSDPELEIELVQRNAETSYTIRLGNALPAAGESSPALDVGDPTMEKAEAPPRYGAIGGLTAMKGENGPALGAVLSSNTAAAIVAQARLIAGVSETR